MDDPGSGLIFNCFPIQRCLHPLAIVAFFTLVFPGSAEEKKQVELWQKYLLWEKSNPLKSEDQKGLFERVKFAYEQCLLVLGHHPNIWYEAAQFYEESAR